MHARLGSVDTVHMKSVSRRRQRSHSAGGIFPDSLMFRCAPEGRKGFRGGDAVPRRNGPRPRPSKATICQRSNRPSSSRSQRIYAIGNEDRIFEIGNSRPTEGSANGLQRREPFKSRRFCCNILRLLQIAPRKSGPCGAVWGGRHGIAVPCRHDGRPLQC